MGGLGGGEGVVSEGEGGEAAEDGGGGGLRGMKDFCTVYGKWHAFAPSGGGFNLFRGS